MSDFQSDIRTKMAAQGDSAGKAFASAFQDQLKASFASLPDARITADADTAKAKAELDDAAKPRTAKIRAEVAKVGLQNPLSGISPLAGAGVLGGLALGPQAIGLGAGLLGVGAGFASAAADAGAFGVVAKGMFTDVTTAQAALTAAQAAYNKATTDKGRAAALAAEKAALDGLTPAEQQLAVELTAVTGAWKSFQQAQQPVVGAAIGPWLQAATDGMRLLGPLVTDGANAIELLGNEADAAVKSPFWTQFSTTLGTTGEVALQVFGTAVGQVGDGLAHLFVTFAPDIQNVLPLVDKATGAFDNWAKSVTSAGLDNFFAKTFSPANVAALKTDLGDVASIVKNLAGAAGQLSPTAFSGLSNVLAVLAKLSPGQIEALSALYGVSKALGGAGNLAKLATGGASLSLPGIGGKSAEKTAAADAEKTAAKTSTASKLGKVGSAAASASVVLPLAAAVDQAIPKGPGGEWVNSWAPYEKIFTNDLPEAWSISYEAFQVEFAGKMTAFFTESVPHFFTGQIPMGWSTAYEGFQRDFAGPLTSWFTGSLPHFFTGAIPANVWSPAYEGFENDLGSPIAAWFTNSLPHFFGSAGSLAEGWGKDIGHGLETGWNATQGAVTSAFGAAKGWVTGAFSTGESWLKAGGTAIASGLDTAWTGSAGGVKTAFGAAKGWVTGAFSGASGWLTAAGKSVMSGFLSSLESEYTSVQSFVSSVAGWIAAHKGPVSEDYKLLQPAGRAIMGGFGDSLKAGFSESVAPVITGIAPAVLAGMAGAQSLGALSQLGIAAPARLPGVGSPVTGGQLQLVVTPGVSDAPVMSAIVNGLQFHIQATTGGDVQAAIGLGPVR
jgi:hypothetical protein